MKEKKIYTKIHYWKGWGFAAVVFAVAVFTTISIFPVVANPNPDESVSFSPDATIEIGKIEVIWSNNFFPQVIVRFFLENKDIDIVICGDEVDIRVIVDCKMVYLRKPLWDKEIDISILLHLNDINGSIIGKKLDSLDKYEMEKTISVDGEFDTYKNESRRIWCEISVTPVIDFSQLGDFHLPWHLRLPCAQTEEVSCFIDCEIVHEC